MLVRDYSSSTLILGAGSADGGSASIVWSVVVILLSKETPARHFRCPCPYKINQLPSIPYKLLSAFILGQTAG